MIKEGRFELRKGLSFEGLEVLTVLKLPGLRGVLGQKRPDSLQGDRMRRNIIFGNIFLSGLRVPPRFTRLSLLLSFPLLCAWAQVSAGIYKDACIFIVIYFSKYITYKIISGLS